MGLRIAKPGAGVKLNMAVLWEIARRIPCVFVSLRAEYRHNYFYNNAGIDGGWCADLVWE
jgi:hypothetical protein